MSLYSIIESSCEKFVCTSVRKNLKKDKSTGSRSSFAFTIATLVTKNECLAFEIDQDNSNERCVSKYSAYNFQIVDRLQHAENKLLFMEKFGEQLWSDSIEAYQQIAEAMQQNEIIVMNIRAVKQ